MRSRATHWLHNMSKLRFSMAFVTLCFNCTGWTHKNSKRLHLNVNLFLCIQYNQKSIPTGSHSKGPKRIAHITHHTFLVFSTAYSSRYWKCFAPESALVTVRGLPFIPYLSQMVDFVVVVLLNVRHSHSDATLQLWLSSIIVRTRCDYFYFHRMSFIFGDDIIACNQILNSLSTNDATLKQWHLDSVNLADNAIKWE